MHIFVNFTEFANFETPMTPEKLSKQHHISLEPETRLGPSQSALPGGAQQWVGLLYIQQGTDTAAGRPEAPLAEIQQLGPGGGPLPGWAVTFPPVCLSLCAVMTDAVDV